MKKLITLTLLAVVNLPGLFAQIKQDRNVAAFSAIKAGSAIRVIVTMSDKESLTIEAEEKLLPKIQSEVKDNELHLYIKGNSGSMKGVTAHVSVKSLKALSVSSAASAEVTNMVTCDNLKLEASSAASIDMNATISDLHVKASGAATVKLKGSAKKLTLSLSGASDFKGKDFIVSTGDVKAEGASSAKVVVKENLKATASGASDITYGGNPKNVTEDASGASTIKKM